MRKHATSTRFVFGSLAVQTTWIVDGQNPAALPSSAAAMAAASDGDTIRLRHAIEVRVPVAGVMVSGGAPWNVAVPSSPALSGQPWMWQGVTLQPSGLRFGPPGLGVLR